MPMGPYANFDECVNKNKDKKDPKAYCGSIKQKVEGKEESFPLDFIGFGAKGGPGSGRRSGYFGNDSPKRDETIGEKYPGARRKYKEPKYGER